MTDWIEFAAALAAFFGSHLLPARPGVRERLTGLLGRRLYFALYGTVSLLVLAWVIVAAGRAPYVELWPQTPASRWVPNVTSPIFWTLVVLGIRLPWPWTLGGQRAARFDPDRPGFAAVTRHPLLIALMLWSFAHLFPNGDLAHVILFGSFFGLSLAAIPMFDARARRALPPCEAWDAFRATSIFSLRPLLNPEWLKQNEDHLIPRLLAIVAFWAAALALHPILLGVSPLPH
ncbi:NnrU family protein [Cereibacter azotoformans]|uniref:NnrU family protein n=2 Tax=Cereibacter TaxID=1653176 RepID=A4WR63_CERS5|nr:NnrU family protein [Cereibacter azotoformans]AXQ93083.1 NnrU family protein [Cereibacter sphaeroides]MBO4169220.1 NnrU family protein [Cereibacter azotoformans]PTR15888.1 putative membrane protein [Cereibacter azotoformans]UIJ31390.1 NnrU family protein [Cereibacter azotoformans]ULB09227.1 NnrU family protein [Cereibacter azotoformans]